MSSEGPYGRQGYNVNAGGYGGGSYSQAPGSGGYSYGGNGQQQPAYGGGYQAPPAGSYGGASYGQQPAMDAYQVRAYKGKYKSVFVSQQKGKARPCWRWMQAACVSFFVLERFHFGVPTHVIIPTVTAIRCRGRF